MCCNLLFTPSCLQVQGLKDLLMNHEIKLCLTGLKDVYAEWEQAEDDKQVWNQPCD